MKKYAVATMVKEVLHMCYDIEVFQDLTIMTLDELHALMDSLGIKRKFYNLDTLDVGQTWCIVCDAPPTNSYTGEYGTVSSLEVIRVS